MSAASNARRIALSRHSSALQLDGDFTRNDVREALKHLRFDNAGNIVQPIVIDEDIRDLLVMVLGR